MPTPRAAAERLTALVDGLAARWLSGALVARARASNCSTAAIDAELG